MNRLRPELRFREIGCLTFVICLAFVITPCDAQSESNAASSPDLVAMAMSVQENFQPVEASALNDAEEALREALDTLQAHLDQSGVTEGWKSYLDWDQLLELLDADAPETEPLAEILNLFTANYPGLEQPEFRNASEALRSLIDFSNAKTMPDASGHHQAIMKRMVQSLKAYESKPTQKHARTIEQGLAWLDQTHQAEKLVRAVREEYSHTNLRIEASARFVAAGLNQPIDTVSPIREQILGAAVSGQGRMRGTMKGKLFPDLKQASLQLNIVGRIDSSTVSRKSSVVVRGTGVTSFQASKTLSFDQDGFSAGVTRSSARSNNQAQNVDAPFLIKPLARIQVASSQDKVNRASAQRSLATINKELDAQADGVIQSANDAYRDSFRDPLLRSGSFPQQMNFSTSGNVLNIEIDQSTPEQLGAPQPAPDFELENDIGIRLHESVFNNIAEVLLAGKTLTDEDLRSDVFQFMTMRSLDEYSETPKKQSWSLSFADEDPVSVSFREGAYTLTIAGKRWAAGPLSFQNLNVSVIYRIDSKDGRVQLVRDKDVLIAPPGFEEGKDRLSPLTNSARQILKWKFEQLLPPVINPDQLIVPGPWKKAGPLQVVDMDAEAGWLRISWKMSSADNDEE